jgi:surfeit locus 1 family protein
MSLRFIVPAVLIASTVVFLMSLGFWQLDRADQKRAIEASIVNANSGDAEQIKSVASLSNKEYYRVLLKGSYLAKKQFVYDNQIVDQISGYYVLTPFVLEGQSGTLLVNRGFVPWNGRRDKLEEISVDQNPREVEVQISKPIKRIELKLSEIGDEFPVLIQAVDLDKMGDIAGIELSEMIGLLGPSMSDGFVRKWKPYTGSIEKHVGYAIQWFLMALVLTIIGIRIALKQRKNNYI